MAEGNDLLADLKELEGQVGRKTPECLLACLRDAVERGDRRPPEPEEREGLAREDGFSEQIRNLKMEMRWLRRTDVKILRQLVAVHEGIEALRWLTEERGNLASCGSSLTGSQSSLVTVEGPWPSVSLSRESPVPVWLLNSAAEETEVAAQHRDVDVDVDVPDDKDDIPEPSRQSAKARPAIALGSRAESGRSEGDHQRGRGGPADADGSACTNPPNPQVPVQDFKSQAGVVRRASVRSNRAARKELGGAKESPRRSDGKDSRGNEKSVPSEEEALFGYDAQWRWVESQDDVTFV